MSDATGLHALPTPLARRYADDSTTTQERAGISWEEQERTSRITEWQNFSSQEDEGEWGGQE